MSQGEYHINLKVNDNLNVSDIVPHGKLSNIYPRHSAGFYQKYWKPIIESLGHFCLNSNYIIKSDVLPDLPNSDKTYSLCAWDCENKKNTNVDLSFKGEEPVWIMKPSKIVSHAQSTSKYNENDYQNSIVRCIDKSLESIYNRTGSVIQVIPLEDIIEIDVNFGRGLGVVRLTEDQINIVA